MRRFSGSSIRTEVRAGGGRFGESDVRVAGAEKRRMEAVARLAVASLVVVTFAACAGRVGPGVDRDVIRGSGPDTLELTYLGSGGWIIRRGTDVVLPAPFFSNPGFVRTGLAPIASDSAEIDRNMAPYDVRDASAILVGHAHYDHLMDVPGIARRHAPRARIVGSRTVENTLGTWSGMAGRIDRVEAFLGDQETVGGWMPYGDRVRIMPLRSHHAPHFDGMTLYQGTADVPRSSEPRTASEWLDGHTVAFLIDFLAADGSVAWRIYYQDAVVHPPLGFAPEALIAQRPVDIAILVPATFDQVEWHPEAFIENLQPERVLLGHWEDFFVPIVTETKSVMLSDIGHFEDRLERVFGGEYWRPEIGTVFRFGR